MWTKILKQQIPLGVKSKIWNKYFSEEENIQRFWPESLKNISNNKWNIVRKCNCFGKVSIKYESKHLKETKPNRTRHWKYKTNILKRFL